MATKDLKDKRFGRLLVLERFGSRVDKYGKKQGARWLCVCDCGTVKVIDSHSLLLKENSTKSCGCLQREAASKNCVHGDHKTRLYSIWENMKRRCRNPNYNKYYLYGGRGIRFCKEWNEYTNFKSWAVNNGYEDNLTLDRINTNGEYCPENCRWATIQEQNRNTRRNILITINDETLCLKDWCIKLGLNYNTLVHWNRRHSLVETKERIIREGKYL